jgi:hypothetical protein
MSLTYTVGQTIVWGLKTYSPAGALADLGGGNPTATVTKPDATTTTATVAKTATGTYTGTFLTTLTGRHRVSWTGSGDNSGGLPYVDVADVWPVNPRFLISLADARAALNVAAATVVDDDELRGYLTAATVVVEHMVGPVLVDTREVTVSGRDRLSIPLDGITGVVEVVEDGSILAAADYCFDEHGNLWRGSRPGSGVWSGAGVRNVAVEYTVGAAVVPDNVRLAAAHLVRHWWQQGQQSYYVGGEPEAIGAGWVAGYAVPNYVRDLLAPSMSFYGFA